MTHFEQVVRLNPGFLEAYVNIGVAHMALGRRDAAVGYWRKVAELKPDSAEALNSLAWVLATTEDASLHNPVEALKLAERACALTEHGRPELLDTLAAAYAAMGRFSEAAETAERAMTLAERAGNADLARQIQDRLRLYRSGRPYRE
jgi:spermidine synthase